MTALSLRDHWYQELVDDCQAIITEAVWRSRWELILGHHLLGKRIATDPDYQKNSNGNGRIVQCLAEDINQSERTIYYSIKFFELYPDPLKQLPDGKNISWTKVVALLSDGNEKAYKARTFNQRLTSFETSLEKLLNQHPEGRDEIVQTFWRIIGGEWK